MEQNVWGKAQPVWLKNNCKVIKENVDQDAEKSAELYVNQYVEFRQNFFVDTARAKLTISCDSRAAVYLNQKLVGFVLYDGTGHTSWYEEFELQDYLKEGMNQLQILVFYQGVSSNNYTVGDPYLIFHIESCDNGEENKKRHEERNKVLATSGAGTLCRRNLNYQNGPVEKNQMGFVWNYDETKEKQAWSQAVPVSLEGKEFRKRPILRQVLRERQPAKLHEHGKFDAACTEEFSKIPLTPISLENRLEKKEAYYEIWDCMEECSGFLELEIETDSEAEIRIGWGEHLADKRVRSHIGSRHFETSFRCGVGHHTFTHYFQRIGLRYLELHVYPKEEKEVKVLYAGIRPLEYPVQKRGNMEIAEELHQKIYDISVRTLQLCMHEHYEDTPWREQALYAMDSLNQALCGYYCFGEYDFARASLELMGEGLLDDGYLELHTPGKDPVMIPYFTFMWVLGLRDYLQFSGDASFIKKHWSKIEMIVEKRLAEVKNGLLPTQTSIAYWNFYEWTDLLSGEPIYREKPLEERIDAPYIMSFLLLIQAVKFISEKISETSYAEKLSAIEEKMKKECHRLFWNEEAFGYLTYAYRDENGVYAAKEGEYAQLVQAWAVLSGVADGENKKRLLEKLAEKENGWIPCTLSMIRFKYEALLQEPKKYGKVVFEDIAEIWGNMVKQGATSFWETEEGEAAFGKAGSLCHGWSAMPVYFYYAYLLGIRPVPGETDRFVKEPVFAGIKAKGQITTFEGTVIYGETAE